MTFLRPEFAPWWQLVPCLVALWAIRWFYVRRLRRLEAIAPRFAPLSRRASTGRELTVLAIVLLTASALVVGLMRPQAMLTRRTPEYEEQDLVLVLDRSASMRAHDVSPSRFARATREIRQVLQSKPEGLGRVGLVGFAGSSLILSHLTTDLDTVAFYLDWIEQDRQTFLGTDIGAALKNAREIARKDTRQTRKLFLLISDGEDYGGELTRQVAAFRADGQRIYTIGIGSDDEVPVPVTQEDGTEAFLQDESGRVVRTRFAETTLRQVAEATGGRYVRSTTGTELAAVIEDIVKVERTVRSWRTSTEYRDIFPAALAAAALGSALLWLLI